jgi:hypothetical protein
MQPLTVRGCEGLARVLFVVAVDAEVITVNFAAYIHAVNSVVCDVLAGFFSRLEFRDHCVLTIIDAA